MIRRCASIGCGRIAYQVRVYPDGVKVPLCDSCTALIVSEADRLIVSERVNAGEDASP